MVKGRRAEDQVLDLVLVPSLRDPPTDSERTFSGQSLQWVGNGAESPLQPLPPGRPVPEESTFLLDLGTEEVILMGRAALRRIPRGKGGQELLKRAAAGAAAWERERVRTWRRLRLPEQLSEFSERLNRAESVAAVCRILTEHVVRIVDGYGAFVLLRDPDTPSLYVLDAESTTLEIRRVMVSAHPRLLRPGVIRAAEAREDTGTPFSTLASVFEDTGVVMLAHVPLGENGVLCLPERRRDRTIEVDEWDLLRSLASQAEGALQRVHSLEEVRRLSLTDPLTGLGNRRRMGVVMEHAWAAARRGQRLAVVILDVNHFKRINDQYGHPVGDRVLRVVADALREAARGSDVVVRYGGDEFLVILPGGDEEGAASLLRRVRERLAGRVELSAGVAEYEAGLRTPEELLELADSRLYEVKRRRGGRSGEAEPNA